MLATLSHVNFLEGSFLLHIELYTVQGKCILSTDFCSKRNNLMRRGFVIAGSFLIGHFMYFCSETADFAPFQLLVVTERLELRGYQTHFKAFHDVGFIQGRDHMTS